MVGTVSEGVVKEARTRCDYCLVAIPEEEEYKSLKVVVYNLYRFNEWDLKPQLAKDVCWRCYGAGKVKF